MGPDVVIMPRAAEHAPADQAHPKVVARLAFLQEKQNNIWAVDQLHKVNIPSD